MDDALLQGIKVVTYLAPFATQEEANEAMRLLGAVEWYREADLFAFLVANPTAENIQLAYHVLDAEECRIGDQDAAKKLLAKGLHQQTLKFVQVQIAPKKGGRK